MDNFQFWLYIIVAVIYVVSRALKKAKQDNPQQGRPKDVEFDTANKEGESPRQLTFEELLREITETKQPKPQPQPISRPVQKTIPKPAPAYVDYDDDLKDEVEELEEVNYEKEKQQPRAYDIYEKAKKEAFLRPSLEETLLKEKNEITYSRFKEFSTTKRSTVLDEYVAELKKPSGFKKAVVLSEILNRRFETF